MLARGVRGGIAEVEYVPPRVERARIINVHINDWSVDAATEISNKKFLDIQVASPYFHFQNGEGIYVQPEVGALCWVCSPSEGLRAPAFILGFGAEIDERKGPDGKALLNFRNGRQSMNPGDIMLRTRDENFIILRRGGVVQIGATPIAQRLFIPVRNIIRDMCENYDLFSLAGEMTWSVDRTDQTTDGEALTTCSLKVKNKASDSAHAALLTIGSHKDDDKLTLNLLIKDSGAADANTMIQLKLSKEGAVDWSMEKDFNLTARKNINLTATEENVIVQALAGEMLLSAAKDVLLRSGQKLTLESAKEAVIKASKFAVDAPSALNGKVSLGSNATHNVALGDQVVRILDQLIDGFTNPGKPHGFYVPVPGTPILFPALAPLRAQLQQILSQNTKTS